MEVVDRTVRAPARTQPAGSRPSPRKALLSQPPAEREQAAESIAARLDLPVTVAGVLFVLVVVADNLTAPGAQWRWVWDVAAWTLWALFVAEFAARMVVAPSTSRFLRRNWWQAVFLALPFLRFLRALTRSARVARAVSGSVRGTRTAGRTLGSRVGYLGAATVGVVLASSQVLFEYGPPMSYAEALHDTTLATVSGEPIGREGAVAGALEVALALYATILFASLAGTVGAFFLERRGERHGAPTSDVAGPGQQVEPGAAPATGGSETLHTHPGARPEHQRTG